MGKQKNSKIKVLVAMSGGVDSSVAAALLKKEGFEVTGLFMHFWSDPALVPLPNKCCSLEALKAARAVASVLGIPLHTLDFRDEFKEEVVNYFISEYKCGRTPNPCVVCNKKIKFGLLLVEAKKLGADFLATGHYARIKKAQGPGPRAQSFHLLKGVDENKDQSYFLWQLNQKELAHLLFPIGEYKKEEVKKLAQKFKLSTAKRPESQEICFVPSDDYRDFLANYLRDSPKLGPIFDLAGNLLGEHQGLPYYTIGQRKGLPIKVTNPVFNPYYVLKLDKKKNALIVGKEEDLYKKEIELRNVSWISDRSPKFLVKCKVKIRYGMEEQDANVKCQMSPKESLRDLTGQAKVKCCQVVFKKPQRAVTPGQSAVIYLKDEVIGGGIIEG